MVNRNFKGNQRRHEPTQVPLLPVQRVGGGEEDEDQSTKPPSTPLSAPSQFVDGPSCIKLSVDSEMAVHVTKCLAYQANDPDKVRSCVIDIPRS